MQEQFFLWLDESGDFKNESKKITNKKNPSLVGGVLLKGKESDEKKLTDILGEDFVKSSEVGGNYGMFAVDCLRTAINQGCSLVVFENRERLEIVDSTTTYLNILAEGIIQLMQHLAVTYDDFILNVLIAVRLDMEREQDTPTVIRGIEYEQRLREKFILAMARRSLSSNPAYQYRIEFDSARTNKKLMLADIVCNTWLTKHSRKFCDEQREFIREMYSDELMFSVIENPIESYIKSGDLASAIFELSLLDYRVRFDEYVEKVLRRFCALNANAQKIQFQTLSNRFLSLILIDRKLLQSKKALICLQDIILQRMIDQNISPGLFTLDVCLHLCTIYTHEGDVINSDKQFAIFESAFKSISKSWEVLDYYFIAKVRKIVHLTNCFDFLNAVKEATQVIQMLNDAVEWLSMIDDLKDAFDDLKVDLIGKALGARLQAYSYTIRKNKEAYQLALDDSEHAIKQFSSDADKKRQYQYRAQITCDSGRYKESLQWLQKASNQVGDISEESIIELLNGVDMRNPSHLFLIMHYIRLMAQSAITSDFQISDLMYQCLSKEAKVLQAIKDIKAEDYPVNIILWKLGTFFAIKGSYEASKSYYKKSTRICFLRPECLTLIAIGLGVLAEKTALFLKADVSRHKLAHKEAQLSLKELMRQFASFMEQELPESMRGYFAGWGNELVGILEEKKICKKSDRLFNLSRDIPY